MVDGITLFQTSRILLPNKKTKTYKQQENQNSNNSIHKRLHIITPHKNPKRNQKQQQLIALNTIIKHMDDVAAGEYEDLGRRKFDQREILKKINKLEQDISKLKQDIGELKQDIREL